MQADFGGTEMYAPIQATISNRYKDLNLEILLLTDGEIWDQQVLFDFLNKQVTEAQTPLRVFTLGVGSGVSHALIEGIARAGHGFSQAVSDGEKMDSKLVRMLKGAMSPHVTDYTLEVKYASGSAMDLEQIPIPRTTDDDDDDFELVERVEDCLKIDVSKVEEKVKPPKNPISLFDPSVDLDKADDMIGEGRFSHLPAVHAPKIMQTPHVIPPLYAFNRTTVYLLMSPECSHQKPKSVILRGKSRHGPLELEIPIQILDGTGELVHQLAAKKAIAELEQGRGWLKYARDQQSGKLLSDVYESCIDDMVEREAVRLGVQFQVGGRWTSFVAVEERHIKTSLAGETSKKQKKDRQAKSGGDKEKKEGEDKKDAARESEEEEDEYDDEQMVFDAGDADYPPAYDESTVHSGVFGAASNRGMSTTPNSSKLIMRKRKPCSVALHLTYAVDSQETSVPLQQRSQQSLATTLAAQPMAQNPDLTRRMQQQQQQQQQLQLQLRQQQQLQLQQQQQQQWDLLMPLQQPQQRKLEQEYQQQLLLMMQHQQQVTPPPTQPSMQASQQLQHVAMESVSQQPQLLEARLNGPSLQLPISVQQEQQDEHPAVEKLLEEDKDYISAVRDEAMESDVYSASAGPTLQCLTSVQNRAESLDDLQEQSAEILVGANAYRKASYKSSGSMGFGAISAVSSFGSKLLGGRSGGGSGGGGGGSSFFSFKQSSPAPSARRAPGAPPPPPPPAAPAFSFGAASPSPSPSSASNLRADVGRVASTTGVSTSAERTYTDMSTQSRAHPSTGSVLHSRLSMKIPQSAAPRRPPLEALIELQTFEGFWEATNEIARVFGLTLNKIEEEAKALGNDEDLRRMATALAIRYFESKLQKDKDTWELV
ncbi:hypothetical protein DFQ27_000768, partial [Actinomortierella ambigua]